MLNMLIVSNNYASAVATSWQKAFTVSSVIMIIFVLLLFVFISWLIIHSTFRNSHPTLSRRIFLLLSLFAIIFVGACLSSDMDNPNSSSINSPHNMESIDGVAKKHVNPITSKYTVPNTIHIINHNSKINHKEWKHDEYLLHHAGKQPKHDHVLKFKAYVDRKNHQINYQKMILKQQEFNKVNSKYCTKRQLTFPSWYDYL